MYFEILLQMFFSRFLAKKSKRTPYLTNQKLLCKSKSNADHIAIVNFLPQGKYFEKRVIEMNFNFN